MRGRRQYGRVRGRLGRPCVGAIGLYVLVHRCLLPPSCSHPLSVTALTSPSTLLRAGPVCAGTARSRGRSGRFRGWWKRPRPPARRSEEHTSELQSRGHLVCRLLLEKKKKTNAHIKTHRQPARQRT